MQQIPQIGDIMGNVTTALNSWKFRRFSLLEKIIVVKSLVVSQLVYVLAPLKTDHKAIKELNAVFYKFLWNEKGIKASARE